MNIDNEDYTNPNTELQQSPLTEPELHVANETSGFKGKMVWVPVVSDEPDTDED